MDDAGTSTKDGKGDENSSADVAFLYKTMLQRDPSKRRVKPVEQHLMQIHFGMSDDDDTDSDYEFKPGAGSDDDIDSDEFDGVLSDNGEVKDSENYRQENSDKDRDDDGSGEGSDITSDADEEYKGNVTPSLSLSKIKHNFMKACCVCLSSTCDEDEIIECDGCGILVHEGCYGTVEEDALSVHSNMSTESTEPWFCDPCKAGVVPSCELCPNQFGIFKQTDTGRWVHLICALYVPAVAFGNTQKLTNVTLLEMPYAKWGSKECSLCEDDNYSYAGVCIGCDAGMCRSYFHVTCAHKQGLLSEASIDEEIADPFYAHCRMHGDKLVSKQKKRNFLALHSHVKQFRETKGNRPTSQRTKRRLEHFKNKFKEAEAKRPPAWVPPSKLPRSLSSSASAVNSLLRKAELLGVITSSKTIQQKSEVISKKSYVAPAMTVEFSSYYEQRTAKIESLKRQNKESLKQNQSLQSQERKLEARVDQLRASIKELQTTHEESRQVGFEIFSALEVLTDKIKIPEQYKPNEKLKSPTAAIASKGRHTTHPCGICNVIKDQHLLAKCDQCFKYYHLYCLDPPLTRMPKKTKLCGWVCSICDHKNHQTPVKVEEEMDTEAPRRLRQMIKEPDKFSQPELKLFVEKIRRKNRRNGGVRKRPPVGVKQSRSKPGRKRKLPPPVPAAVDLTPKSSLDMSQVSESTVTEEADVVSVEPAAAAHMEETEAISEPTHSPIKVGRKSKQLETGTCRPCETDCNGGNAVRCDDCFKWYHFACLDPPVKKSPKHRGYQWYCDECEKHNEEETSADIVDIDELAEVSESWTMEIVQGEDSGEKKVVSFDGAVTAI